jgi:predicted permease
MISFFLLSLPIFAVIGVGWAATRTRLVSQGALDALNAFSFRFALPALLLRLIAGQPLRQSFNPEFYIGYLASGAITDPEIESQCEQLLSARQLL